MRLYGMSNYQCTDWDCPCHNLDLSLLPSTDKTVHTDIMESTTTELTFGQKAVGLTFNPGGHPAVNRIKTLFAAVIDDLNDERSKSENAEVKRQLSVAITETQTAQMWAVKAVTWQY